MISAVRPELSSYLGVSTVTEKVGKPESKLSRREWEFGFGFGRSRGSLVLCVVDLGDLL